MIQIILVHYKNCYKNSESEVAVKSETLTKPVKLWSRFESSRSKLLCAW